MFAIIAFFVSLIFLIIAIMIVISLVQLTFGNAPFVPIRDAALASIWDQFQASQFPLSHGSVCIDIGCGNGKVLTYLALRAPTASFIGIEYSLIPYLMARWTTRKYSNIIIIRKNFLTYDFSAATHIFTYLFPQVMDLVFETILNTRNNNNNVLSSSLKKETHVQSIKTQQDSVANKHSPLVIISCDFIFTKIPPTTISEIPESTTALTAKKLFTYHL